MFLLRRAVHALVLLGVEAALVVALVRVGGHAPFVLPLHDVTGWLATTPPADAIAALAWLGALAGAWWLLVSTVLYALACAARIPSAVRATRWATLPLARRIVDVTLAVSLTTTIAVSSHAAVATAANAPTPPPPTGVRDGRTGSLASLPPEAAPTTLPPLAPTPPALAPLPPPEFSTTVVVAPGDNLWELAAAHLAATSDRTRAHVADAEIAPHWVSVCETNRPTLQSGDPNLIFPGEVVTLPPLR